MAGKLSHHVDEVATDFATILQHFQPLITRDSHGSSGLRLMYILLSHQSFDRAYDDSHPAFEAGQERVLPFDGRAYCWYYREGADDTHVATMLRQVRRKLEKAGTIPTFD